MVSMADLPHFPQNQSTLFNDNTLRKYQREVSKKKTEEDVKFLAQLRKLLLVTLVN